MARDEKAIDVRPMARSAAPAIRTHDAFDRHAAIGLWVAAVPLLIGNGIDLFTLWVLQRQFSPTWEFVAIGNTIDAFPRIALSVGLLFPAAYLQRWNSIVVFRILSAVLIALGLAALTLGLLQLSNYLVLRNEAASGSAALLYSSTIKALGLSGSFFVLLTVLGVLGWRRPRR